jgi:TonB-linked SusC/RagA family outer membrane protein
MVKFTYANDQNALPMIKKLLLTVLTLSMLVTAGQAQDRQVSGKVTSQEDGSGIPGVNIVVQGTTKGTTTDVDGNYTIQLTASENTLVFTFVGFQASTIQVEGRSTIDVTLVPDVSTLDEIVVVGYGTQREKDLTSSITTVRAEDIAKTPSGQAMQALQGKVPGLQVVSAGSPGSSPTVRIRGIGTYPGSGGDGAPLYVVDGMFFDNIDFLNPTDIKTISVFKDASAKAIYGVRAANGVVLIETNKGVKNQPAQISYDGYYGYQVAQNVLKMSNSEQFATMAVESESAPDIANIDKAMQRFGRSRINPNVPDVNTDWYKEILRPAAIQNHNITVAGGGDKASYNYFNQDGILDMKNNFERLNIRMNVDYDATDWLTIGGNMNWSNATRYLPQDGAWNQAYYATPFLPVYDELNTNYTPIQFANAQDIGYRGGQNPRAAMTFNNDRQKIRKNLTSFYATIKILKDNRLTFRSALNIATTNIEQRTMNLPYYLGDNFNRPLATLTKRNENYINHIWDNVLTFNQSFGDHNLTVMAGTSFRDESYQMLRLSGSDFADLSEHAWYLNYAETIDIVGVDGSGNRFDDGYRLYGMSYFGRLAYNFKDRYLLYATMRADGTQKYQEKWGYFPSFGAGWVISEESFMDGIEFIDFLKLRGSWGQTGNDKIRTSAGANTANAVSAVFDDVLVTGLTSSSTFNYLRWELVEETNLGITANVLDNRLSVDFDYFIRDTKDAAIVVLPQLIASENTIKSAGEIRNSGIELALTWKDELANNLSYTIGVNFGTLKNEVTDLYGQPYLNAGQAEFLQRSIPGNPLVAFYGLKVEGVYQTQEEIDADPVASNSETLLEPGDLKFSDLNNDGKIDANDRTVLGSYLPKMTYGANLGASWKNFDLSVNMMGQYGNKILNRKRGEIIWTPDGNMDADLSTNRWHGPGTSNEYPSSKGLRKGYNQKMSDFFVEDGSFFRIQNIQLAYNIRGKSLFGVDMPDARISFTADRPLTVFKYNGFNPEVADGIDVQTYPIPAVYTLGLNVKF